MLAKQNIHDDSVPWQREAYHVAARFRLVAEGALRLRLVEVEPGGRVLPHATPHAEWLLCVAGTARLRVGEAEALLWPGDFVEIAAGAIQGLVNDGAERLTVLLWRAESSGPLPALLGALLRR